MVFNSATQIVFWSSAAALFYTYAGYPIFVYVVSLLFPKPVKVADFEPKVTVLITAYSEERHIHTKINNTLELDYPKEKLEILITSDGSTDKTDEIVKEFATRNVNLFRQEGRVGKTVTQNKAVVQVTSEIVLFSVAATMYETDILRRMLTKGAWRQFLSF
jgi:cellulose synthase/poly-beta-1,6-N-acetylglucosamine synthase-like glycosyltransferase